MTMRARELPLDTIWPRIITIADEMATTLYRTAFTHDVIEVHDMSTGLYDDRGYLIGQTWLGATGHVGVMPYFGKSMLEAARKAVPDNSGTKLVAVTVLTSLSAEDLEEVGIAGFPEQQVLRLAHMTADCGLDGVVCSASLTSPRGIIARARERGER